MASLEPRPADQVENPAETLGRLTRNLSICSATLGVASLLALATVMEELQPKWAVLVFATNGLMAALLLLAVSALIRGVKDCLEKQHTAIRQQLLETVRVDDLAGLAEVPPPDRLKVMGQRGS
jgi:hypothetical protein